MKLFGMILLLMGLLHGEIDKPLQLHSIESNSELHFEYGKSMLVCRPYGVVTLEHFTNQNEGCRKSVEAFYLQHPELKHWAAYELKVRQFYRVRTLEGRCLVYSHGQQLYSEGLLKQGLAAVPPGVGKEWRERFKRLEKGAQRHERGIWAEAPWQLCFESVYGE